MVREHAAWQPGWQTADDLREEWYEAHGWVASPPKSTLDEWAAVRRGEEEYYRANPNAGGHTERLVADVGRCVVGGDVDPILVVPAHPQVGEGTGDVAVELLRLVTGEPVVVAFTSVEGLVETLGRYQPWLRLPGETVVSMSGGILLIDPDRDVVQPIWTEERFKLLKDALS